MSHGVSVNVIVEVPDASSERDVVSVSVTVVEMSTCGGLLLPAPPPLWFPSPARCFRSVGDSVMVTESVCAGVDPVPAMDAVMLFEALSVAVTSSVLVTVISAVPEALTDPTVREVVGEGRVTVLVSSIVIVPVTVVLLRSFVTVGFFSRDEENCIDDVTLGEFAVTVFDTSMVMSFVTVCESTVSESSLETVTVRELRRWVTVAIRLMLKWSSEAVRDDVFDTVSVKLLTVCVVVFASVLDFRTSVSDWERGLVGVRFVNDPVTDVVGVGALSDLDPCSAVSDADRLLDFSKEISSVSDTLVSVTESENDVDGSGVIEL
jgi:hypothetical protein